VSNPSEAAAKSFIYTHESGNVPCKVNGGAIDCNYDGHLACGIGQALRCQKPTAACNLSDYACQDQWFTQASRRRVDLPEGVAGETEASPHYGCLNAL
jgi:hypothetical protein